ncbi:MAG: helix-turn-helix domain-containing protein, partial [Actinomycetota bacterium]|nr:helix-turn-helix domain-containing protein [Actinomycetota bacterium]
MRAPTPALVLTEGQREVLRSVAKSQTGQHRDVQRAKALLLAAKGVANTAIGAELQVSPATVKGWRDRFARDGLVHFGEVDKGRGRRPSIPAAK